MASVDRHQPVILRAYNPHRPVESEASPCTTEMAASLLRVNSTQQGPARVPAPARPLATSAMQLQRGELRRMLTQMLQEASSQTWGSEPTPLPRWIRALRVRPKTVPMTPVPIGILMGLNKRLYEGDSGLSHLDIKECAAFSLDMEALAKSLPIHHPWQELSRRLALLGQAAWAQLARAEAEAQLLPQFKCFDQPGAIQDRYIGGTLGGSLGVGGVKVMVNVGLGWNRGMDTDDQGYVYVNNSKSVLVKAGLKGNVGIAELSGAVQGRILHTEAPEFDSARVYLQLNAHKLSKGSRRSTLDAVSRTVIGALIRWFRPDHGNELQHYQQLQQQAADQQQRLDLLLGLLGLGERTETLPGAPQHYIPPKQISSKKGSLAGKATVGIANIGNIIALSGHVSGDIIVERVESMGTTYMSFWEALQQPTLARDETIAAGRLLALAQQANALFGDEPNRNPLSRLFAVNHSSILHNMTPEIVQDALTRLETEFEYLCVVAQQVDAGIGRQAGSAAIEQAILASWRSRSREEAIGNMALAHAILGQQAIQWVDTLEGLAALDGQAQLQRLAVLASRLYAPPIRHDEAKLTKKTSFCDHLIMQRNDLTKALSLGGNTGSLGAQVSVSLTDRNRNHLSPFRAGDYQDLQFTLFSNMDNRWQLEAVHASLQSQLPFGLAADLPAMLAEVDNVINGISGMASGSITLLLRFYRPKYQQQADFPAKAAGYHLQFWRVSYSGGLDLNIAGAVPLQPGMSLDLALTAGGLSTIIKHERWGDNSLTAPFLHYLHLKNINELDRWQTMKESQRPALTALFHQLAKPDSAVAEEAKYFFRRQQVDETRFFEAMTRFAAGASDFATTATVLDQLLDAQYPLWLEDKRTFDGWQEMPLRGPVSASQPLQTRTPSARGPLFRGKLAQ